MDSELVQSIRKLYLFAFASGAMFFFGIEQLFLETLGDGDFARGVLLAVFSGVFAITNLPTGALSDIWGRVNSLRLAGVFLVVSLLILSLSNSILLYAIGTIPFALFWSLWDGAAEAFLYDKLADHNEEATFEKFQGRVTAALLVGAASANLISGFLTEATSLRFTYVASLLPALIALAVAFRMVEPEHHRQAGSSIKKQLRGVYREVQAATVLKYLMIAGVSIFIFSMLSGEFTQPVIVRFTSSPRTLGIVWMALALFMAAAASQSHRLKSQRLIMGGVTVSMLIYVLFSGEVVGIIGLIGVTALAEAASNKNASEMQKQLPSKLRASIGSVTSTVSNAITPVLAIVIGVGASKNLSLFLGGIVGVLILITSGALIMANRQKVGDTNRSIL